MTDSTETTTSTRASIVPTRISATNIGSILGTATIEPDTRPDGVTVLDGPIGTGKSTLLNTLPWVLWGNIGGVPTLTPQGDLRAILSDPDDDVVGKVEFTAAGSTYRAIRSLRHTSRGTEESSAELWIDGVQEPHITPTRLTERITALSGVTGRAAVASHAILQSHLTALAHGTAADVEEVVVDQAGLRPYARQVADALRDKNKLTVAADALPGSADTAQQATDHATATAQQADAAAQAAQQAATDAQTARYAATQARDWLRDVTDHAHTVRFVTQERANLTRSIEQWSVAQQAVADQIAALPADSADTLIGRHTHLTRLISVARDANHRWTRAHQDHAAATQEQQRLASMPLPVPGATSTQEALDVVASHRQQAGQAAAALQARLAADTEARNQLTRIAATNPDPQHTPTCPTCTQPIHQVQQMIDHYDQTLRQVRSDLEAAHTNLSRYERDFDALNQRLHTEQQLAARIDAATREQEQAVAAGRDAGQRLAEFLGRAPEKVGVMLTAADDALADLARQITAARNADTLIQQRDRLDAQISDARTRLGALTDPGDGPTPEQIAQATRDAQTADTAQQQAEQQARDAATAAAQARAAADQAARDADHAQQQWQAKQQAVAEAQEAADFWAQRANEHHERLIAYTERVSKVATDIIARFDSEHVAIHLGDDFVPRVERADGIMLPIRSLSGGEKVRAAACLCLARAVEQNTGILIGDEITESLDPDSAQTLIEVVTHMGMPVILVGHNDAVRSAATRLYTVSKPVGGSTTITRVPLPTRATPDTQPAGEQHTTTNDVAATDASQTTPKDTPQDQPTPDGDVLAPKTRTRKTTTPRTTTPRTTKTRTSTPRTRKTTTTSADATLADATPQPDLTDALA